MFLLRRSGLLLAAALCVAAQEVAAQTVRLSPEAVRRLRQGQTTIRVAPTGVDTVRASTVPARVPRGEMIVSVTERPGTVLTPLAPDRRPPLDLPVRETPPVTGGGGTGPGTTGTGDGGDTGADKGSGTEKDEDPGGSTGGQTGTLVPMVTGTGGGVRGPGTEGRLTYELGYEIGVSDRAGERFHILVPIVEVEGGGLRYDPAQRAYVGTILLGLVDRDHPSETGPLSARVMVQITGDVQSLQPVTLDQINIPFRQVSLRVQRPLADSIRIRLRPTFDPTGGAVIAVPLLRAPLTFRASPRSIAGFGLEVSDLTVQTTRRGDTLPVILTSLHGKPRPGQLDATYGGAVSRIRSAGVGWDTVKVAIGDYEEMVVLHYRWPIAFLLAALFGGLIGGVLNALSTHRRSDARTVALLGAQGALIGAVAAVLYAIGINVVGWAPAAEYGEALMFAVAFMSGLMGPRIFDRFLPKLSVGRKDGDDAAPPPPPPPPSEPASPEPAAVG